MMQSANRRLRKLAFARRRSVEEIVCDRCSTLVEVENTAIEHLLADDAASLGFEIHRRVVELQGLCAQCVVSA